MLEPKVIVWAGGGWIRDARVDGTKMSSGSTKSDIVMYAFRIEVARNACHMPIMRDKYKSIDTQFNTG